MTTLTVQIMTGRRWYKNSVGKRFDVRKDPARDFRLFYLVDPRALSIDKDDCIVTAVNYETEQESAVVERDGAVGG